MSGFPALLGSDTSSITSRACPAGVGARAGTTHSLVGEATGRPLGVGTRAGAGAAQPATVMFKFMPRALWPGTGQKTSYLPLLSFTVRSVLWPGAMFFVLGLDRPGPVISSEWVTCPLFRATKVYFPALKDFFDSAM